MASTASSAQAWADDVQTRSKLVTDKLAEQHDNLGIMREVRMIGGAMITILLIAVVLNEVFSAVNVGSGPFSSVGTDLETTGVAAISLLIVGLIIVAANALLSRFGGGF